MLSRGLACGLASAVIVAVASDEDFFHVADAGLYRLDFYDYCCLAKCRFEVFEMMAGCLVERIC